MNVPQEAGSVGGKRKSLEHSALLVGLSSRTIGNWVREFETTTFIVESKRGRHAKTVTPINDEGFRAEFKSHVKENSRKPGIFFNKICTRGCSIVSDNFRRG